MTTIPRPEHPKPQFQRERWLNLNGAWKFAFDFGVSGEEKGWHADASDFDREILVPFCPESRLSGVGHTDFIPAVWYHRTFSLPEEWRGQRIFLHFGAVDFDCRAWINGQLVGRHWGGSSSFCFDITEALQAGENGLTVCALDDIRSGVQPGGKQCAALHSHGCLYTRTTGIWQTVWLEARPATHLTSVRMVTDFDGGRILVTPTIRGVRRGLEFRATALSAGEQIVSVTRAAVSGRAFCLALNDPHPWSPADPFLYDLRFELLEDGQPIDAVASYAGVRKFHIEGNRFYLNNKPLFLRFVLDQGFYPEGIWTAPSDDDLRGDVERSLAVGFNGARLHQKVFEERFHYWADKLGYLTWGEYCDWGPGRDWANPQWYYNFQNEWREIVMRDLNHPSIVAWTPTNESRGSAGANLTRHRRVLQNVVDLTRQLDPTRPINDASGYVHVDTDIYTVHCYDQNPESFREKFAAVAPGAREGFHVNFPDLDAPYADQPYVVDEYGGTWWNPDVQQDDAGEGGGGGAQSWGYGKTPASLEEVYHRLEELTKVLTSHPHIAGYTYTQLTDVEQEQNGIYTYDRREKFDAARLRQYFGAPAAIEAE